MMHFAKVDRECLGSDQTCTYVAIETAIAGIHFRPIWMPYIIYCMEQPKTAYVFATPHIA